MTHPIAVAVDARAPAATGAGMAAELAARIHIPRRLPPAADGRPLRHISHSSYTRFIACPEDWRRHYLKGERTPPSGAMVLGSRVDDAITGYHRQQLEHGETLALDQVQDLYRDLWQAELAGEQADRGVVWEDTLGETDAFQVGLEALAVSLTVLVPQLGRPVAVQRRLEFAITEALEWTVQCWLDLETVRADDDGEPVAEVVDYKVKNSLITQARADRDPQAGLYLAGRWLTGDPAGGFRFAQIAKPGPRRKQITSALITTTRSTGQLRATLARIAQAAGQIDALHRRFGPDEPWGFADPTGWRCSERFCGSWRSCPGGAGL